MTDFRFIPGAPRVAPKKQPAQQFQGKKRMVMLHSDSDEDNGEEEKFQVNKQGLYLEHGFYVKNKKRDVSAGSAQPNAGSKTAASAAS